MTAGPGGFHPIGGTRAKLLILGSFPGVPSLERAEYYGFARNRFWSLMERLFRVPAAASYVERKRALVSRQVAVWDVIASCVRVGSSDSRIDPRSVVPNPIAAFLGSHRSISVIALNGTKALSAFQRWIRPTLGVRADAVRIVALPSTSPANARLDLNALERQWRRGIGAPR